MKATPELKFEPVNNKLLPLPSDRVPVGGATAARRPIAARLLQRPPIAGQRVAAAGNHPEPGRRADGLGDRLLRAFQNKRQPVLSK